MRKIIIEKPGGYEKLKMISGTALTPAPDEICVDIKASGINYADVLVRWGLYKSAKDFVGWPITPGFEYSGVISKVGANVSKWKIGDEVVGVSLFNGYASEICVPQTYVYKKPKAWTFEQTAAFPAVLLTAYHALLQNIVIRKGSILLVHSAAGGVGSAILQVAKILGYKTVAVVGSKHKIETANAMGADYVIDKSSQDLWKEAEKISPTGYDVVLDANGVATLEQSWKHLNQSGKLVIYGFHTMLPRTGGKILPHHYLKLAYDYLRTPKFHPMQMTDGNKSVVSFNISYLWNRRDILDEAMTDLLQWIDEGKIKPLPVTSYDAEDVAKAHIAIESGQSVGKLVLTWQ